MKKLRILINPISGHGLAPTLAALVDQSPLLEYYEVDTQTTEYAGHAGELAKEAVQSGYAGVIAVGGDGTVNEVASQLLYTSTALGIIPAGSGNGLARHLKYSLKFKQALLQIANATVLEIDALQINHRISVNVSGLGFDGFVAWRFNHEGKRGLSNYTRIALQEYFKYPIIHFTLTVNGSLLKKEAHMLVIANASQFGNKAIIAPSAELNDGKLDLVLVKKPPLHKMPSMFYRLFNGKLKTNQYVENIQCEGFHILCDRPVHLHIDGEAVAPLSSLEVKILPSALKVFMPENNS